MMFFDNICHRIDHILGVFLCHGGIERERNNPVEMLFGIGEVPLPIAKAVLISTHQMNRNKVNAGSHIALVQFHNKLVTVNIQHFRANTHDIKMPAVRGVGGNLRHIEGVHLAKGRLEAVGNL